MQQLSLPIETVSGFAACCANIRETNNISQLQCGPSLIVHNNTEKSVQIMLMRGWVAISVSREVRSGSAQLGLEFTISNLLAANWKGGGAMTETMRSGEERRHRERMRKSAEGASE